jgi:uncharacterized lipoprotein YmbA
MRTIILPWTLSLSLLLFGCGSSPRNDYYLLSAGNSSPPSGETPTVGIGPIEIAEYLKRDKLVYIRQGNKLQVAVTDSWAEPLEDGIRRVLTLNLASQLNTHNVRAFPWHPKRAPDYGVKLNLFTLDANNSEATLRAEWLVYRPADAEPVQRRISELRVALTRGGLEGELRAARVAAAYSALLEQLTELIADAIRADQLKSSRRPVTGPAPG